MLWTQQKKMIEQDKGGGEQQRWVTLNLNRMVRIGLIEIEKAS